MSDGGWMFGNSREQQRREQLKREAQQDYQNHLKQQQSQQRRRGASTDTVAQDSSDLSITASSSKRPGQRNPGLKVSANVRREESVDESALNSPLFGVGERDKSIPNHSPTSPTIRPHQQSPQNHSYDQGEVEDRKGKSKSARNKSKATSKSKTRQELTDEYSESQSDSDEDDDRSQHRDSQRHHRHRNRSKYPEVPLIPYQYFQPFGFPHGQIPYYPPMMPNMMAHQQQQPGLFSSQYHSQDQPGTTMEKTSAQMDLRVDTNKDTAEGNDSKSTTATPTSPTSANTEKTFLRGVVRKDQLPDWKREELERKQKQLAEHQALLKQQMEERERQKEIQKKKQQEEDERERERIARDLRELEERYRQERELVGDKDVIGKKGGSGTASGSTKTQSTRGPNPSLDAARDIAMEKYLQAQKEAEELKKAKFKSKRAQSRDESNQNVPSQTEPREFIDERPLNVKGNVHAQAKNVTDELMDIKKDLERDRSSIQQYETPPLSARKPAPAQARPRKSNEVVELKSVSRHVPISSGTSKSSRQSLDTEVVERLAQAKMKRLGLGI